MTGKINEAELIERIARVHARQQVHYTINRGVRALDYGTPDDYADCFTAEAAYEGVVPDGSVQRSRGTAELRRFAAEFKWPPGVMRHWLGCSDVEIDHNGARVSSLKGALGAGPSEVVMRMVGRNSDTLAACPDGRWRFASRLSEIISRKAPK